MINFAYFTRPQLKVLSAISADFSVVWLLALLSTKEPIPLLTNAVFAIVALTIAIKSENQLEL